MQTDHRIEIEIELEATPERVWEAIATGPGLRAWFGPLDVEPRAGGLVTVSIGDFVDESAVVAVWNPPKHFSTTSDGHSFDYIITEQNGTSKLRLVHAGSFGQDWETHLAIARDGWDMYLHTLSQYLKYFSGRPATYVAAEGPRTSAGDHAWPMLRSALGLPERVEEGDAVHLTPEGMPPIDGVIDYDRPACLGVRSGDALYRFHNRAALGMPVGVGHHYYSGGIDRAEAVRSWQSWLERLFPLAC